MTPLKAVFIAGILLGASCNNVQADKEHHVVVMGRNVQMGEYPYQAQFGYATKPSYLCGAIIIDKYHVLTADLCVIGSLLDEAIVVAGTTRFTDPTKAQKGQEGAFGVAQAYITDKYARSFYNADIALLRIVGSFKFDDTVSPVPLRTEPITEGDCIITGWGVNMPIEGIEPGAGASDSLNMKTVPLIKANECNESLNHYGIKIEPGIMCAGVKNGGVDECKSDAGGPVVCSNQLTGIVTFLEGCVIEYGPTLFTDVIPMLQWIKETLLLSYKEAAINEEPPLIRDKI